MDPRGRVERGCRCARRGPGRGRRACGRETRRHRDGTMKAGEGRMDRGKVVQERTSGTRVASIPPLERPMPIRHVPRWSDA
eukprot:scaffold2636_cov340-Pavlova_lutheri.AAC.46